MPTFDKAHAERQFEIAKMYALRWHAMATVPGLDKREMYRYENGIEIRLTPAELAQDAMDIMKAQIERMCEISETIEENTK